MQELQKELAELRSQFKEMKAKWENEKEAIGKVQKLREEIDRNVQKERPARLALALCTAFAVVGAVLLAQHYFIGPVYQLPA